MGPLDFTVACLSEKEALKMKVIVVLVLCVVFANGSSEFEGETRTPMTPEVYASTLREVVKDVNKMENTVEEFTALAGKHMYGESNWQNFDKIVDGWMQMKGLLQSNFDSTARVLLSLAFKLDAGSQGFKRVGLCKSYRNFNQSTDPQNRNAYIEEMADNFGADLGCFRGIFSQVEQVEEELLEMENSCIKNKFNEESALSLVLEFFKRLHLVRLNAERYAQFVEDTASRLFEEEKEEAEEKRAMRALENLLKKRTYKKGN